MISLLSCDHIVPFFPKQINNATLVFLEHWLSLSLPQEKGFSIIPQTEV